MEPFTLPHNPKITYHRFTCVECGAEDVNTYSEPYRSQMLERSLCWSCNYNHNLGERLTKNHAKETIIGGHTYGPGNRTSGSMRGMAGRRFDIEYIAPSIYAGQIITTFDLWSGADLPPKLREKYPDTARFLNGAEEARPGGVLCWNPSSGKTEPYKLPRELVANKPATASASPSPEEGQTV